MNGDYKPKGAFDGYVYAKLESIIKTLDAIPARCDAESKRISALENKVANIEGKATVFGAVAGLVMSWLGKHFLGK